MSTLKTRFTEMLGIEHPIMQDGMGPFKTARLAAAVSEAGGIGSVSLPGMAQDPVEGAAILKAHIEETASLTTKPFAVNIPVGRDDRGIILPVTAAYIDQVIDSRAGDSAIASQLRLLTTSAGFPGEFRERIRDAGLIHAHKVGSTRHALKAVDAGVDIVIASGYEMGGHTHATPMNTFVLVPNVTEAIGAPVLLSGGARDGRTLAAALCLGAVGVAMGTRFIASEDNVDWHRAYAERVLAAKEGDDVIFPGVYGPARGLRTRGVETLQALYDSGEADSDAIILWKDQAMQRAQEYGEVEDGLLPAGQVSSGIHDIVSVREFVPRMAEEAQAILSRLGAGGN